MFQKHMSSFQIDFIALSVLETCAKMVSENALNTNISISVHDI